MEKKIDRLIDVCSRLQEQRISFAWGASVLLYFSSLVTSFGDLDLFVNDQDMPKVLHALRDLGPLDESKKKEPYRTRSFYTLNAEGVSIDVMGGFAVCQGEQIAEVYISADAIEREYLWGDVLIPLMYLEDWLVFYRLMGRLDKVALLEEHFKKHRPSTRTGIVYRRGIYE